MTSERNPERVVIDIPGDKMHGMVGTVLHRCPRTGAPFVRLDRKPVYCISTDMWFGPSQTRALRPGEDRR